MNTYRIAAIGTGGIFQLAHSPAWRKVGNAAIVALCDADERTLHSAAEPFANVETFADVDDLLAWGEFDVVDICTPHGSHAEMASRALRAGKHVICEKPIALDVESAARVIQLAEENDRRLFVTHNRRFDRRWIEAKNQIVAGRIGEPVAASWRERSWAGFGADAWRWQAENGAILADLGVHVIDLFAWLLDDRATSVFARTQSVRPEARESDAADFALLMATYGDNKQALMEFSWAHPTGNAPFYAALEVIGTEGKLRLSDQDAAPMVALSDTIDVPRYSPMLSAYPESFTDALSHFIDCIDTGSTPVVTAEDAAHALAVAHAAEKSARSKTPVPIAGGGA